MLGLLPTVWLRDPAPNDDLSDYRAQALPAAVPSDWPAAFSLEGAWELESSNRRFGGFSALAIAGGTFILWSDRGDQIVISKPGNGPDAARFGSLAPERAFIYSQDIESVVYDEGAEFTWFGYENPNALRRVSRSGQSLAIRVPAMTAWGDNAGAEAMVRLPDGRFLALAEKREEAALFPDDPFFEPSPVILRIDRPQGWQPTDMAMLPDGRVLVLLRKVEPFLAMGSWPPFRTMLAVADPALIDPERPWRLEPVLTLDIPELAENYEGMAVEQNGPDSVNIWLIADDNLSALQRSLLLKLRWDMAKPKKKAPEAQPQAPFEKVPE